METEEGDERGGEDEGLSKAMSIGRTSATGEEGIALVLLLPLLALVLL